MRKARAWYIGGWPVGTGIPRVEILGKVEKGSGEKPGYLVQVVSKKSYAFKQGEIFTVSFSCQLADKKRFIPGPKCEHWGDSWKAKFEAWQEFQTIQALGKDKQARIIRKAWEESAGFTESLAAWLDKQ